MPSALNFVLLLGSPNEFFISDIVFLSSKIPIKMCKNVMTIISHLFQIFSIIVASKTESGQTFTTFEKIVT